MLNLPTATVNALKAGSRQAVNIIYSSISDDPDEGEEDVYITEADIMQGGLSVNRQCPFGIGEAYAAELKLSLYNKNGKFNSVYFDKGQFNVKVATKDWNNQSATLQNVPLGKFYIDSAPRMGNVINISAIDRMILFDKVVTDWSAYTFPMTLANFVQVLCTLAGVTLTQPSSLNLLPNATYTVYWGEHFDDVTLRTLLRWASFLLASNAYMDWNGELLVHGFAYAPVFTIFQNTASERYVSDITNETISITKLEYASSDGTKFSVGNNDGYILRYSGCELLSHDEQTALTNILNSFQNLTFAVGSIELFPAPFLWPMDSILYQPNGICIPITEISYTINRHTHLICKYEGSRTNATVQPVEKNSGISLTESDIIYIKKLIAQALANI